MQRFVITVDKTGEQLNDGPLLVGPGGGCIVYFERSEAEAAARGLVEGGTVKGAFVQLLRPVAFYTEIGSGAVETATQDDVSGKVNN